ncbi:hypothetical protein M011DRAFT_393524 [Sporormia fimetaria CBS 119925]|uniref:TPR-like protein n=1 Tax=Sporormia fimetaria CBS 119925 TaxID=1340428 RepID=A0A6A6VRS6_9PLEO|nr:hypothetical protein M011DRAFT_393524 [Sporormia fimetaria CBS 119925]
MPPKRKDFLRPNPKPKAKAQEPQSENDFLEAADDFEQSAGKWRAGDAAKATRFYNRAIDMYNAGLQRYPKSFDLAYNKANLEYNMIQDERIAAILSDPIGLLQEALQSHRAAVALDKDNLDVQFNTAQVLTSLSEALIERGPEGKTSAKGMLEEAVSIFTKCLARQQDEYDQTQAAIAEVTASQNIEPEPQRAPPPPVAESQDVESSSSTTDGPVEWATVVEPITPDSLLETCTAQLGTLTTLLSACDPSELPTLQMHVESGLDTIETKIPAFIKQAQSFPRPVHVEEPQSGPQLSLTAAAPERQSTPEQDALLAAANFQAAICEGRYRAAQSTTMDYATKVEQLYAPLTSGAIESATLDPTQVDALSAYADALFSMASAISDRQQSSTSPPSSEDLEAQWTALTHAQTILTKLSSAPNASALTASQLANIFSVRGDIDLSRFHISLLEAANSTWAKSKAVLVSNAGVFYRGSRSYADRAGAAATRKIADAKAIVAEILKQALNGNVQVSPEWKAKTEEIMRVLQQMVEEGVISVDNGEHVIRTLA